MKRGNLKMPVSAVIITMMIMIGGCGKQAGYEDAAPTQPALQEIQETDFTLEGLADTIMGEETKK